MSDKTGIEWTDSTWNPLRGCTRVSEGCRNCYAEGVAARFSGPGQPYEGLAAFVGAKREPRWTGKVALVEHTLDQPLRWRKPRRIFVNSMSDLFHESVPDEWIDRIFAVMALCPQHTFQVLTKRPERMREYMADGEREAHWMNAVATLLESSAKLMMKCHPILGQREPWLPLLNVWLGVSVEDQTTADGRIPPLLDTPAAKRFISAEPLLGPLDLLSVKGGTLWIGGQRGCGGMHRGDGSPDCPREPHHHHDERCGAGLDWVIVGGESGPNARPMHPDWVRSLRDQCAAARVPFFFKQWGEWLPFAQSGFHHWAAANIRKNGVGKKWLGHAYFNDGAGGPETHSIGPVETTVIDNAMTQCVKIGKKSAGHLLDGRAYREFPA